MHSDSIFLFCLEKNIETVAEHEAVMPFGEYQIKYCKKTPMVCTSSDNRELLIYGYAVNVLDGTAETLGEAILASTHNIEEVISYEVSLGGKYLLFYRDAGGAYVIPDATASISFCYSTGGCQLVCASNSEEIAKKLSLQPDEKLRMIRNSGDVSQAMPYDLTVYREIKQLLPNHYFSLSQQKAIRFLNHKEKRHQLSPQEAAKLTAPMIETLFGYYQKCFKLYCPITGGRDSRVVLSYMLSTQKDIEAYTIHHKEFTENTQDVCVPVVLSQKFAFTHKCITDIEPTSEQYAFFGEQFGNAGYSKRTLMIANTIKTHYHDGAIINGDIIGQVGKCSLHRDIPVAFATAKYFRCKLHNYSKASATILKDWIADIKKSGEQVNLFDMFSMESRMGRWAVQENLIYAMVGQSYLNIFNSRSIVYPWTLVPRKERKHSCIHEEIIRLKYPALLDVPYGDDGSKLKAIAKHNGLTYYISSFLKYYKERLSFKHKRRNDS